MATDPRLDTYNTWSDEEKHALTDFQLSVSRLGPAILSAADSSEGADARYTQKTEDQARSVQELIDSLPAGQFVPNASNQAGANAILDKLTMQNLRQMTVGVAGYGADAYRNALIALNGVQ